MSRPKQALHQLFGDDTGFSGFNSSQRGCRCGAFSFHDEWHLDSRRRVMALYQWVSLGVVMFLASGVAGAAPVPLKATNTWTGSIDDEKLAKAMPENGVITNAKDFEALVKAWKVAAKVPEVNFDKEIVLVARTVGSRLNLNASLDEKGDLKALGMATSDLGPGFRYVIISVPKEGVRTVNGKELPK
jgi:hypothetical protein